MELYIVYIRSMCTYKDYYNFDKLDKYIEYDDELNIFEPVGFFNNYDSAYNWLIENGKKLTDNFFELHDQGCAFVIVFKKTIQTESDELEDFLSQTDLYLLDRTRYHYTFSKESNDMCLTEHLRYVSHEWDTNFPNWIKYVQDKDNISIGCNTTHMKKVHKLIKYSVDDHQKKKNEIKMVTKYLKTKNLDDVKEISKKINDF